MQRFLIFVFSIARSLASSAAVVPVSDIVLQAFQSDHIVRSSAHIVTLLEQSPLDVEQIRCALFGDSAVSEDSLLPPQFIHAIQVLDSLLVTPLACASPGLLSSYVESLMRYLEKDHAFGDWPLYINMSASRKHTHVSIYSAPELAVVLRRLLNPRVFRLALEFSRCLGVSRVPGEMLLHCLVIASHLRVELVSGVDFDEFFALRWTIETVDSVFFNVVLFDLFRASEGALLAGDLALAGEIDKLAEKLARVRRKPLGRESLFPVIDAFRAEVEVLSQSVMAGQTRHALEVVNHNLRKYGELMAEGVLSPADPAVPFPFTELNPTIDAACTFRLRVIVLFGNFEGLEAELSFVRTSEPAMLSVAHLQRIVEAELDHLSLHVENDSLSDLSRALQKLVQYSSFYSFVETCAELQKLAVTRRIPTGAVLYGGIKEVVSVYAHIPFALSDSVCTSLLHQVATLANLDESEALFVQTTVEVVLLKQRRMPSVLVAVGELIAAYNEAETALLSRDYRPLRFVTKAVRTFKDLLSGTLVASSAGYAESAAFMTLLTRICVQNAVLHLTGHPKEQLLEASTSGQVALFGWSLATVGASMQTTHRTLAANAFYVDADKDLGRLASQLGAELPSQVLSLLVVARNHISTGLLFRTLSLGDLASSLNEARFRAHMVEASRKLLVASRLPPVSMQLADLSTAFQQVVQVDLAAEPFPALDEFEFVDAQEGLPLMPVSDLELVPARVMPSVRLGLVDDVRSYATESFPDGNFADVADLDELVARLVARLSAPAGPGRKRKRANGVDLCSVLLTSLNLELEAVLEYLHVLRTVGVKVSDASSVNLLIQQVMSTISQLKADIARLDSYKTLPIDGVTEFIEKLRSLDIPRSPDMRPIVQWVADRYAGFIISAIALVSPKHSSSASNVSKHRKPPRMLVA